MLSGDITESTNLTWIIREGQVDEISNKAVQPHAQICFDTPEKIANTDTVGEL